MPAGARSARWGSPPLPSRPCVSCRPTRFSRSCSRWSPGCWSRPASTSCSASAGSSSRRTSCWRDGVGDLTAGGDRLPVDAVLEDLAVAVNREVGREATGAVTVTSVSEPLVRLLEALDLERRKAYPGRGQELRFARRETEAPDRERVRRA